MKTFNPKMSFEAETERLQAAMGDLLAARARDRHRSKRFYSEVREWQELNGDVPVGDKFQATLKEIQVMKVAAEKKFTQALNRHKPGKPRPRLTVYELVQLPAKTAPAKKLWEP